MRPKILKKLDSQCKRWRQDMFDDSSDDEDDIYVDSFYAGDNEDAVLLHSEGPEGRRLENDHKFLY